MTTSTKTTQVLNDVIAVQLHFSVWTGRKKLDESDLSIRGETPPKEVINLGSKHTTDPKALKVFNTLKRQAERLCLSVGIPFLGGYAIPSNKADDVAKRLSQIVAQYEAEKAAYLLKHEEIQSEWIESFPVYENILRKALTPVSDVEQRISGNYSMFQVQSAQSKVATVDTGLDDQVNNLSHTLDADILKSAQKLLERLTGALQPNQANVRGLKDIREKVEGLAFLNGRFSKLVTEIKKIEGAMPISGKLSTDETHLLSGLLFRMSDKNKLASLMTSISSEPNQAEEPAKAISSVNTDMVFDSDDFEFDIGETPVENNESNPAINATFF